MSINSKKKGNRAENDVAKFLKEWSGHEFGRVPMSGGLHWKKDQRVTGDVIPKGAGDGFIFPFSVEVKFHKEIQLNHILTSWKTSKLKSFWEQASDDAKRVNNLPLLFFRYNRLKSGLFIIMINRRVFTILKKNGYKGVSVHFGKYSLIRNDALFKSVKFSDKLMIKFKDLSDEKE